MPIIELLLLHQIMQNLSFIMKDSNNTIEIKQPASLPHSPNLKIFNLKKYTLRSMIWWQQKGSTTPSTGTTKTLKDKIKQLEFLIVSVNLTFSLNHKKS